MELHQPGHNSLLIVPLCVYVCEFFKGWIKNLVELRPRFPYGVDLPSFQRQPVKARVPMWKIFLIWLHSALSVTVPLGIWSKLQILLAGQWSFSKLAINVSVIFIINKILFLVEFYGTLLLSWVDPTIQGVAYQEESSCPKWWLSKAGFTTFLSVTPKHPALQLVVVPLISFFNNIIIIFSC